MKWYERSRRSWRHRVRVERRQLSGFAAVIAAMSGERWQYWCTCNARPVPYPSQPMAFAAGLSHLAITHGEERRAR